MGLDMHAYRTKHTPTKEVDFSDEIYGEEDGFQIVEIEEIAYWRKHPNLHGWMERLYREKGGKDGSFNGDPVVITLEDLERLEDDVLEGNLPETRGFFFGQSGEEKVYDLKFVHEARKAIREGDTVFYDSSW
jgi:hypothetical protein